MEEQIQHVRYVRSADGTTIAYSDVGEGVPLVLSSNIWTHLDMSWGGLPRPALLQLLRDGFRLVRYDMRGMGMSDRDVEDFSLERQMEDLDAVRERVKLERFALFGFVHATPACIAYAARYPERITHLILSIPFASGEEWYRAMPTLQGLESLREFSDEQWELYTLTHAAALTAIRGVTDAKPAATLMRVATTPQTLRRYLAALRTHDVTALLGSVRTPTMVIQSERNAAGEAFSRSVAAGIPDATLVAADTAIGSPTLAEAAHVTRFVLGREPSPATNRRVARDTAAGADTAIILFTDVVDSTGLTERLGDVRFRERYSQLDASVRAIIAESGGTAVEGRTLGDGVLATFTSARDAIAGALRCAAAADECALPLHLGIHAGDVLREQNNVYGGAVNIASRISALSTPGEVLVSRTVAELARTSAGVVFEDRGEQVLKGVGEPQRVYAVIARSEP